MDNYASMAPHQLTTGSFPKSTLCVVFRCQYVKIREQQEIPSLIKPEEIRKVLIG